jgi:hypothetical protein
MKVWKGATVVGWMMDDPQTLALTRELHSSDDGASSSVLQYNTAAIRH